MRVVADTSVFNYLILLDQLTLLPALYGHIVIPSVVLAVELPHTESPEAVRTWAQNLTVVPEWLEIRMPTATATRFGISIPSRKGRRRPRP